MSYAHIDRAKILTEALPYIQRYNGKTVVINCGGRAMSSPELRNAVVSDIILLRLVGVQVVLVHGIGPEVTQALEKQGKRIDSVEGLPCIDRESMEIVQQVLCGKVNKSLAATLNQMGGKAVGLCGIDGGIMQARALGGDHGLAGELTKVDVSTLLDAMERDFIPVVATVAQGVDGSEAYSVSADAAAAKLAVALGAEKLIHLTDAEGLLRDPANPRSPIPVLELSQVPALIRSGVIAGEMVGKVNCSVEAVRSGVKSATFLDGGVSHSILLELLSDEGIGTMLTH